METREIRSFYHPIGGDFGDRAIILLTTIHLDAWEGRCIETEKGIVRLLPVQARAEQLFGADGAESVADRLEKHRAGPIQPTLFPLDDDPPPTPIKGRRRKGAANVSYEALHRHRGATTLDHVHAAVISRPGQRPAGLAEVRN